MVVNASKPPPGPPTVPEKLTVPMSQHTSDVNKSVSNGNVSTTNNSPVESRQNGKPSYNDVAAGQKVDNQQGRELQQWLRRRAAVRGTAGLSSDGKFWGAPSTCGLFLYRVAKQVNKEDITAWMGSKKINYIHFEKMSNPDAMFQSFKITLPADDYRESLDPELAEWSVCERLQNAHGRITKAKK